MRMWIKENYFSGACRMEKLKTWSVALVQEILSFLLKANMPCKVEMIPSSRSEYEAEVKHWNFESGEISENWEIDLVSDVFRPTQI